MGYEGIVITDAMNMGAIVNHYGSEDTVIQAIQAGVDIVLMPKDFKASYEAVLQAVKNGTISNERINDSVQRIIQTKLSISK